MNGLPVGTLTRQELANWDRIDWYASTAALSAQATAALGDDYPGYRVFVGYRWLGWDAVQLVGQPLPSAGLAGSELGPQPDDLRGITELVGSVFRAREWLRHRDPDLA